MREVRLIDRLDHRIEQFRGGYDSRNRAIQKIIDEKVQELVERFDGACNYCGDGAEGELGSAECLHRQRINRTKNMGEGIFRCLRCRIEYIAPKAVMIRGGGGLCHGCRTQSRARERAQKGRMK